MTKEIQKYPYNARTEDEIKVFLSDKICEQVVKVNYKNGQIFCTVKDRITSQNKEIIFSAAILFGVLFGMPYKALEFHQYSLQLLRSIVQLGKQFLSMLQLLIRA